MKALACLVPDLECHDTEAIERCLEQVGEVYDCYLLVEGAIEDLESVAEEYQLGKCKKLRRSLAILRQVVANLENSSEDLQFRLSKLLSEGL